MCNRLIDAAVSDASTTFVQEWVADLASNATCCSGPGTFGVNGCTRDLKSETGIGHTWNTAESDLILYGREDEMPKRGFAQAVANAVHASHRSSRLASTYHRQMATALVAVDLEEDRIAGLTVDTDLRLCTGGRAWPALARLNAWLLVGGWP